MSEGGLVRRGARAALWNYAGNAVRLALQFGIGVLLARLLGPEAFGLVAIALLMIGLGQLVADFGLSAALIQARELRDEDVHFLFTVQFALGVSLTLICVSFAPSIAAFFETPDAAPVIGWMATLFAVRALGQTSQALLSRELRFGAIQFAAISGYVLGYIGAGLPLALSGYGVWSLVIAHLTSTAVGTALVTIKASYRPRFRLAGGRMDLLRFGRHVIVGNLGSWVAGNFDSLIVGRVAGPVGLGLYNRALTLSGVPMGAVATSLYGVLLSAISRSQDNPEGVRKAVVASVVLYLITAGAILLAFTAAPATVIVGLYGEAWGAAARYLPPLALAMLAAGLASFLGWALTGLGRPDIESRTQWIAAILLAAGAAVAVQWSIAAVAWTVLACHLVRLILLARALHAMIRFAFSELAQALWPAIGTIGAVGLASAAADRLGAGLEPHWRLAVITGACAGALGLTLLALRQPLTNGPLGEFVRKAEIVPRRLQRFVFSSDWT